MSKFVYSPTGDDNGRREGALDSIFPVNVQNDTAPEAESAETEISEERSEFSEMDAEPDVDVSEPDETGSVEG